MATVNAGLNPIGINISPDGSKVYVTNQNGDNVSVMTTATNTISATVGVGASSVPTGICVSPDGNKVYVACENSNNVKVIDCCNQLRFGYYNGFNIPVALGNFIGTPPPCTSQLLYVDIAATGANNGSSWADACTKLKNSNGFGLAEYSCTDSILVAAGTYYPTTGTDRTISFNLIEGVKIIRRLSNRRRNTQLDSQPNHP